MSGLEEMFEYDYGECEIAQTPISLLNFSTSWWK